MTTGSAHAEVADPEASASTHGIHVVMRPAVKAGILPSATTWHALPAAAVAQGLEVDVSHGLADAEARARLARLGPNVLRAMRPPSLWMLVGRQLRNPLIPPLLVAAVLSYVLSDPQDALVRADGLEQDLTLLGVIGLQDPPREEVQQALAAARSAGIRTVMVTGDHSSTAVAIARRLGTVGAEHGLAERAMTGTVLYLVSGNFGEILVITAAMLAGWPLPLTAAQVLWINLVTDTLPSAGLGVEREEPRAMARPPRKPGEPFLAAWMTPVIGTPSVVLAAATLAAFWLALQRSPGDLLYAQTAAFSTLILAQLGIAYALRTTLTSALRMPPITNPVLLLSVVVAVALLLLLLYTSPGEAHFRTRPLDATAWGVTLLLMPLPFVGAEFAKVLVRRRMVSA